MVSQKKLAGARLGGQATIKGLGDRFSEKTAIEKVYKLLQRAGYDVRVRPVAIPWEVNIYPNKDAPIRLTDIKTVRKFLSGRHMEHSMWTIV